MGTAVGVLLKAIFNGKATASAPWSRAATTSWGFGCFAFFALIQWEFGGAVLGGAYFDWDRCGFAEVFYGG